MKTLSLHFTCLCLFFHGRLVLVDTENNNETNVIDLRLPYVRVPETKTYYVCQQFEVKDDKPYHVIRFEPIINNTEIIHHMLVFGCEFEMDDKGPHPCDSLDYRCHTWLGKWDVGMDDLIMPDNGGVRIGKGSFKYLLLQIHWNNEMGSKDETDSSGMRLHVTSHLRANDIGNVQIGQNDINIPGESDHVLISGICPGRCTGLMLPSPIYITNVYLHMHGLELCTKSTGKRSLARFSNYAISTMSGLIIDKQQEAIQTAVSGHNFILIGQPGTGKSYTIGKIYEQLKVQ
ncbi:dopamine beta-hydroxylase-like, partial [Ruditapes philippinarum]|uniref:dopamine beta-hydroxylase-like n=1 Tax=Ruditapes philippinarum TaxID=129788 RepID=UPI00295BF9F4